MAIHVNTGRFEPHKIYFGFDIVFVFSLHFITENKLGPLLLIRLLFPNALNIGHRSLA